MAKNKPLTGSDFTSVNEFLGQFDGDGGLLSEFKPMEINDWIHTGNYLLNAHISGSMMRGVPSGRITILGGKPKTGKSYIVFNILKSLQESEYFPWLFETEASPDKERLEKQKIDLKKVRISQPETAAQAIAMLGPVLDNLDKLQRANKEIPKMALIFDSLSGFMPSSKLDSALKGENKADMGSAAQDLGFLLNLLSKRCGKLGIPVICTQHVFIERMPGFSRAKLRGGLPMEFLASVMTIFSKSYEKEGSGEERKKVGVMVKSDIYESRYSRHKKVEFYIPFDRPMNAFFGLDKYITWENSGIAKGKFDDHVDLAYELWYKKVITKDNAFGFEFTEKDLKKNLAASKYSNRWSYIEKMIDDGLLIAKSGSWAFTDKVLENFDEKGKYPKSTEKVAILNDNINMYCVKHLGEAVTPTQLFSKRVFTQELLQKLDEEVIKPMFEYGGEDDEEKLSAMDIEKDEAILEAEDALNEFMNMENGDD